jgi:hypothetical protein
MEPTVLKETYSKLLSQFTNECGQKTMADLDSFQVCSVNGSIVYFKSGKYYSASVNDLISSKLKLGSDSIQLNIGNGMILPIFNITKIANITKLTVAAKFRKKLLLLSLVISLFSNDSNNNLQLLFDLYHKIIKS